MLFFRFGGQSISQPFHFRKVTEPLFLFKHELLNVPLLVFGLSYCECHIVIYSPQFIVLFTLPIEYRHDASNCLPKGKSLFYYKNAIKVMPG